MSPYRSLVDIDVRILLGEILHAGNLIRHRIVTSHAAVVRVVERLRTTRCAATIDGNDNESEFGKRLLVATRSTERA